MEVCPSDQDTSTAYRPCRVFPWHVRARTRVPTGATWVNTHGNVGQYTRVHTRTTRHAAALLEPLSKPKGSWRTCGLPAASPSTPPATLGATPTCHSCPHPQPSNPLRTTTRPLRKPPGSETHTQATRCFSNYPGLVMLVPLAQWRGGGWRPRRAADA